MASVLGRYLNKDATVTLTGPTPTKVEGRIVGCDNVCIGIDQGGGKGELIVPLTSVLYVTVSIRAAEP